jgi:hypothetical protein
MERLGFSYCSSLPAHNYFMSLNKSHFLPVPGFPNLQAFRDMDSIWHRIMARVHDHPLMSEVADTPGMLEELQRCNRLLAIVEKVRLASRTET